MRKLFFVSSLTLALSITAFAPAAQATDKASTANASVKLHKVTTPVLSVKNTSTRKIIRKAVPYKANGLNTINRKDIIAPTNPNMGTAKLYTLTNDNSKMPNLFKN